MCLRRVEELDVHAFDVSWTSTRRSMGAPRDRARLSFPRLRRPFASSSSPRTLEMPSGRAAAVPSDDEDAAASPSPTILLHPRHHRRKEETDESSDEDDDDASESSSGESYHEHKRRHRHHPRRRRRRHSSRAIIVAPQVSSAFEKQVNARADQRPAAE